MCELLTVAVRPFTKLRLFMEARDRAHDMSALLLSMQLQCVVSVVHFQIIDSAVVSAIVVGFLGIEKVGELYILCDVAHVKYRFSTRWFPGCHLQSRAHPSAFSSPVFC